MIRNLLNKAIALYLFPFTSEARRFYYVKDVFFTSGVEHLHRAVKHIERSGDIPKNSVIIDVGGYDGSTSRYFASHFKSLKVYCIEPNTEMAATLKEMEKTEGTIFVKNIALGKTAGEALLHVTANGVSSSLNELNTSEIEKTSSAYQTMLAEEATATVKVSTLDEEFKDVDDVLLLKLDTQGTELDVLKSGIEMLRKTRFVLTEMNNHEIYKNTCQYHEVDEFLRRNSFKLVDVVVSYRAENGTTEYDALYRNTNL